MQRIPVSQVVFRKDLYPRIETSPTTVQRYAADLSVLPPIEVNQHNELIDGWHRWTAHRKAEAPDIAVEVVQTRSDAHFLELAIRSNASHGLQLSSEDKRKMAHRIYWSEPNPDTEKRLPDILSVSKRTVAAWLSKGKQDARQKQREEAFDMWLACHTQEEIADALGLTRTAIEHIVTNFADLQNLSQSQQNAALWNDGFKPPIYNVWNALVKSNAVSHPGNSESKWVENLLYMYTKPFDIACDPFGGGGSTIDVCKKRLRRYYVSDLTPIVEREHEIRQHDVTASLPKPPLWKDVKLVYLDPPYWKQLQGEYSNKETDLSNMELDSFHKHMAKIVEGYADKLSANSKGAKIALMIQPTQWKAPNKSFTDHIADMIRRVQLPIVQRIQCPYGTQQCNATMVEWAKQNKTCLVLSREIIVWEVT